MVEDIEYMVDYPYGSHYDDQSPPPPTSNNPPTPFQPPPLSYLPSSTPSPPHNTCPSSTPGSSPPADDVKKGENDKAIMVHADHFEDIDDQPDIDTDDEEGFMDMDFMSRAVLLNIIYLDANLEEEIPQGTDSDVESGDDQLITRKKRRPPPQVEFMTLVKALLLLPARKGSSQSI